MSEAPVRLPRLLRRVGGTLAEVGRLRPAALSVSLHLTPLSVADMTLTEDDLPVRMHDFVELYGPGGSLGIFRVVHIATAYTKQRKLRLNHALDVLSDLLLPGEEKLTGTARQVLERILAAQTEGWWQLGTVEDAAVITLENRYSTLLNCLKKVAETEEGFRFSYDFGTFPWTLHLLRRESRVLSEFRLLRNVQSCQVTLDDSALCTRLYLRVDSTVTDANGSRTVTTQEVHEDAAAQAIWGVVSKSAGITAEEAPDRAAWVRDYFARHAQPGVQITIDGLELNRLTGEPLDALQLGALCRVALPDYGAVFEERIVSLTYPDLLGRPACVTVSLANRRADASRSMASLSAKTASNAAAARSNRLETESVRYSWRATDRHVTDICTILHAAGLELDAHGVWLYASENADQYALGSSFRVQAQQISSKVSVTDYNGNTIASLINQTATTVSISAQRIDLSGYVTASELYAQKARIDNLVGGTRVDALTAGTISAVNHLLMDGKGAYWLSAKDGAGNTIYYLGRR